MLAKFGGNYGFLSTFVKVKISLIGVCAKITIAPRSTLPRRTGFSLKQLQLLICRSVRQLAIPFHLFLRTE